MWVIVQIQSVKQAFDAFSYVFINFNRFIYSVINWLAFTIIIIILFVQKPKMQQCKLKTRTLNKTHQAQTSSYGGL